MLITRDIFCSIWEELGLDAPFNKKINCTPLSILDRFIVIYDVDKETVSIMNRDGLSSDGDSIRLVSWYKWMHVGRSLALRGIDDTNDLRDFLTRFKEDLEEYEPRAEIKVVDDNNIIDDELLSRIECALLHNINACQECHQCDGGDEYDIRMNIVRDLCKALGKPVPWTELENKNG